MDCTIKYVCVLYKGNNIAVFVFSHVQHILKLCRIMAYPAI